MDFEQMLDILMLRLGIQFPSIKSQEELKYLVCLDFKYLEIRSLPEKYEMPTSTAIFADCVVLQIWGDEPIMILIENKKLAQSYKDTFNILWNIAE
jgi:hypothetical protein